MKTKEVLKFAFLGVTIFKTGEILGKIEALKEVLKNEDNNLDSLAVKISKNWTLTVKKIKEGA